MVEERGNIEKLFQSTFEDYKVPPSPNIWDSIEKEVSSKNAGSFQGGFTLLLVGVIALVIATVWDSSQDYSSNLPERQFASAAFIGEKEIVLENVVEKQEALVDKKVTAKQNKAKKQSTTVDHTNVQQEKKELVVSAEKSDNNDSVGLVNKTKDSLEEKNQIKDINSDMKAFSISDHMGCKPLATYFKTLMPIEGKVIWDFGDGTQSYSKDAFHTYAEAGIYAVTLTIIRNGVDKLKFTDTVKVFEKPEADCELTYSSASDLSPVYFYNYSDRATTYEWSVNDEVISIDKEPVKYKHELKGETIQLKVWSKEGCVNSIVVKNPTRGKEEFFIRFPNAFEPDPTGIGEGRYYGLHGDRRIFHPTYKGIEEYHLEIYNRLGQKIFFSDDINIGWDGSQNGELLKIGVYIWKVRGTYSNGKPFVKRGDVALLKKHK